MSKQPHPLLLQALQAFQDGALTNAKHLFLVFLNIQPKNFDALHVMGVLCGMEGDHQNAIAYFSKAVKINPNNSWVHFNLAKALSEGGDNNEALKHHVIATKLAPKHLEAWLNYGISLAKLDKYEAAIEQYNKALSINSNSVEALTNKGSALNDLYRHEDALVLFEKSLQINPTYKATWSNKGVALAELKRYEEAFFCFDQAITLDQSYALAWSNKGETFKDLKRYKGAIFCLDQAINLQPNLIEGWLSKAEVLDEMKDYGAALICYERALAIDPNMKYLYGQYVHAQMNVCDWSKYETNYEYCERGLILGNKTIAPFIAHSMFDRPDLQLMASKIFATEEKFASHFHQPQKENKKDRKLIRVGYFSSDFRNHAVTYLISEMIELHDRENFEIYGFSSGPGSDDEGRLRLEKAFDHFIDVKEKNTQDVVNLCNTLGIDIAIDLGGYTAFARPELFAQRIAPIQVSYLGFIGTTGSQHMDYIIADQTVITDDLSVYFSEKIIYLPNCYQVSNSKRKISDRVFTRAELGLPESGPIYCCFNNSYKINPPTFDSWMRILQNVEGSVLWLIKDNLSVTQNLQNEAKKRGIDPRRLVFAERIANKDYLARFTVADLFLDTLPYNAGTTANDALFVGLPVLTLQGQSFVGRMASSLLHAINLPELITRSRSEYEDKAIKLVQNPALLNEIKNKLKAERDTSTLFNTELFTRHIETAFKKVFELYTAGKPPSTVHID